MTPRRDNPNDPAAVAATEEEALKLLVGRQSSEWNASSIYVVLAAHATGELHTVIRNVARDEIKHLAILSAADQYLRGPRPWGRFGELIGLAISQYRGHQKRRSAGDYMGSNRISALEVIAAHMLAEYRLRKWLASVPLLALTTVFETPSNLPEPDERPRSPEEEARSREAERDAAERRACLSRWAPRQRQEALAQRAFEEVSSAAIERIVTADLHRLAGAGLPGSAADRQTRRRIRRIASGPLRAPLLGRLRQHQIERNRYVLAQDLEPRT